MGTVLYGRRRRMQRSRLREVARFVVLLSMAAVAWVLWSIAVWLGMATFRAVIG